MMRCKCYKKIITCGNIFLVIVFWADIFVVYIAWNPIFTFLRQFYSGEFANFIILWFGKIVALPRWTLLLLLLRYFLIDSRTSWYLLSSSSPPPIFSVLFCCNKFMIVSFIEKVALSWEIVLGRFLENFLLVNSYCKKEKWSTAKVK